MVYGSDDDPNMVTRRLHRYGHGKWRAYTYEEVNTVDDVTKVIYNLGYNQFYVTVEFRDIVDLLETLRDMGCELMT